MTSLTIGNVSLDSPVILAPMSGVTDLPFRSLVKKFGAGLVISEMIASEAMIRETRQSLKKCAHRIEEFPMAVQLAGCDPQVMAEAARLNVDRGAQIIDINMGCPVKKVVNGHAGSALMKDEYKASKIMEATVNAVKIPVTLKMRMGWDDNSLNAPKLAKIAENCGIKMITIHGRTRCQLYNGQANWPFIKTVKEAVKIPVVGNGDVKTVEDARSLLDESSADAVMIGRGTYGRPWFLNQVNTFLKTGKKLADPSLRDQKETILEHFEQTLIHYGEETGILLMRKHLGWYSKGLPNSADFRVRINTSQTRKDVLNFLNQYYESIEADSTFSLQNKEIIF
ncbi:MAG: tRNA dihydrouridine synthase DusB [Proteobacteria bacterium]|nr:tRNA dihydrouridine synthase DusB [Pseudomonadota bacterium]